MARFDGLLKAEGLLSPPALPIPVLSCPLSLILRRLSIFQACLVRERAPSRRRTGRQINCQAGEVFIITSVPAAAAATP